MKASMYKHKYKIFKIITIVISLSIVFLSLFFGEATDKKYLIIIDNGHGGEDLGEVGYVEEASLNLEISIALKNLLSNDKNFSVIVLNEKNNTMYVEERLDLINSSKADLVISVHNSFNVDKQVSGFEIYCMTNNLNKNSLRFGDILKSKLVLNGRTSNGDGLFYYYFIPVRKDVYRIEKNSVNEAIKNEKTLLILEKSKIPTVVVSNYYLSNDEVKNMSMDALIKSYYEAINEYFGLSK